MEQEQDNRKWLLAGIIVLAVIAIGAVIAAIAIDGSKKYLFHDDGDPAMGPDNAKVTVRMYSDFQCPACKYAHDQLNMVLPDYKDKVKFIWNDFPLINIHANALSAATAARCAQRQGAFWPFADQLFAGQEYWANSSSTLDIFGMYYVSMRLSTEDLASCYNDSAIRQEIIDDIKEAQEFKLQGTPAIFINDKLIDSAMSSTTWRSELDAALEAAK